MSQPNSTWIDLRTSAKDIFIEEHYRSYNEFHKLHFPDEQDPQMIVLIGDERKRKAIRRLELSLHSYGKHEKIYLQLMPSHTKARSPLLIADCELHNAPLSSKASESLIAGIKQHTLLWHRKFPIERLDANSLAHLIYSKLISPFSTIICLFADDLGGIRAVAEILASWLVSLSNRSSDLPVSTYPRVLILKANDHAQLNEEKATLEFMKELAEQTRARNGRIAQRSDGRLVDERFSTLLTQQFGGLRVLALPSTEYQSQLQGLDQSWELLRARILQGSQRIQDRRRKAQVAFSANHFKAFFHLACEHFARDIVTPFSFLKASRLANPVPQDLTFYIADFLRDVKPPQIEPFAIPFIASALALNGYPPEMHVFPPAQVFQQFYSKVFEDIQINKEKIKDLFCQQVLGNTSEVVDSAVTHKAVLSRFTEYWQSIFNNTTCLSCIARASEGNTLNCGHSFCDPCIIIHGRTALEEPWNFNLDACPLCMASNKVKFLLKPYTAGIRALSINGGPRDVFAANFLKEIEAKLPLPKMYIQEHFDIVLGTGSGAIVAIGAFGKGLSLDDCITLSKNVVHTRSLLHPLTNFSSQYSSTRINSVFKKALGAEETLFGCSGSNAKVAIVTTSTKDSSTYIFSNYNGPKQRPRACGHSLLRLGGSKDEILLWQAGRAASATPPYLKSFHGYQCLEDQLSLTKLGLWEQNFLWSRKKKSPDIFLSLGASIEVTATAMGMLHPQGRSLGAWASFITDSLLASLFYIELTGLPLLNKVGLACQLNIQCRLLPSEPHLKTLVKHLWDRQACFHYDVQHSIACVDQELIEEVKRGVAFSKHIKLTVLSLNDAIDVKIDGITKRGRSISNCPYTVNDIIEDQGLHCFFGQKDHQRRYRGSIRTIPECGAMTEV